MSIEIGKNYFFLLFLVGGGYLFFKYLLIFKRRLFFAKKRFISIIINKYHLLFFTKYLIFTVRKQWINILSLKFLIAIILGSEYRWMVKRQVN